MMDDRVRLKDMQEAVRRINKYAVFGRERFESDELVQVFIAHQLVILGEAASRVSDGFRANHPELPWREMIGMRNVLVHAYFTVDVDAVWGVVARDLPALAVGLDRILGNPAAQ